MVTSGSRDGAIARVHDDFDSGAFVDVLARRVAIPSTSQEPDRAPALREYLEREMGPAVEALGGTWAIHDNPIPETGPILVGERRESDDVPTVLLYGHGDTVRGMEGRWREGLEPWRLIREGDRLYGRGTADNKGQHSIDLAALEAVLAERGRLGFNLRVLIETGEEMGSRGLREFCAAERERLAADVLIASDGPRVAPARPTLFLGSRGVMNFELRIRAREGAHHSGNWGGLLSNPGTQLAHALATIVDRRGQILVPALKPPPISNAVRAALAGIQVDGGPDAPEIDPDWGERGLTPWERVFAWNTFEVLAYETGSPASPVNAIPPDARAVCQIRYFAGSDSDGFIPAIRDRLREQGFGMVEVTPLRMAMQASRTDPDDPWAIFARDSLALTAGAPPAVLPSLGGTIPNDVFTDVIGMPTVWVPHSYAGCSQHAPDEHLLASVAREALGLMAGLYWDIGAGGAPA